MTKDVPSSPGRWLAEIRARAACVSGSQWVAPRPDGKLDACGCERTWYWGDGEHGCFVEHAIADLAWLMERVRVLEEALRFQDPRNAAARYDRIADDFERETGLWPPGRSRPMVMGPDPHAEQAANTWRRYVNEWHERWFDAALEDGHG